MFGLGELQNYSRWGQLLLRGLEGRRVVVVEVMEDPPAGQATTGREFSSVPELPVAAQGSLALCPGEVQDFLSNSLSLLLHFWNGTRKQGAVSLHLCCHLSRESR